MRSLWYDLHTCHEFPKVCGVGAATVCCTLPFLTSTVLCGTGAQCTQRRLARKRECSKRSVDSSHISSTSSSSSSSSSASSSASSNSSSNSRAMSVGSRSPVDGTTNDGSATRGARTRATRSTHRACGNGRTITYSSTAGKEAPSRGTGASRICTMGTNSSICSTVRRWAAYRQALRRD